MRIQAGLTLAELLAVLAIIAVTAVMAQAGLDRLLANTRLYGATNEWIHRLHQARHAALSRNRDVVLCPSRDGRQCGTLEHWGNGWLLFVNHNGGSPPQLDSTDTLLEAGTAPAQLRIRANRPAFVMRPYGQRATNGTVILCDLRNRAPARSIVISYTGKPRAGRTTAAGQPLQCEPLP